MELLNTLNASLQDMVQRRNALEQQIGTLQSLIQSVQQTGSITGEIVNPAPVNSPMMLIPTVPKRRGRPPKNALAPEAAPMVPRRRGRPPKNPMAQVQTMPMPRRRGRPPKNALAPAMQPSAPKRRGRPPKNAAAPMIQAGMPKRRGRPPKNPMAQMVGPPQGDRKKPRWDAAAREHVRARMKKYWADRRAQKK